MRNGSTDDGADEGAETEAYEAYTPEGWSVCELKNSRHVIFEYEDDGVLCHVEADGMAPRASIICGRETWFTREASDFGGALALAGGVMNVYRRGREADR